MRGVFELDAEAEGLIRSRITGFPPPAPLVPLVLAALAFMIAASSFLLAGEIGGKREEAIDGYRRGARIRLFLDLFFLRLVRFVDVDADTSSDSESEERDNILICELGDIAGPFIVVVASLIGRMDDSPTSSVSISIVSRSRF